MAYLRLLSCSPTQRHIWNHSKVKGGDGEPGTEASICYTTVTTAVVEDEKLKSSSSSIAVVKENGTSSSSKDEIVLETDL